MRNESSGIKKTVLVSALLFELTTASQAATIQVDNNTCLLSDAISAANGDTAMGVCSAGSGADTLVLSNGIDIVLTTALPDITSDITINCQSARIRRDASAPQFPVLSVENDNLTLNDCTISGGHTTQSNKNGGGGVVSTDST